MSDTTGTTPVSSAPVEGTANVNDTHQEASSQNDSKALSVDQQAEAAAQAALKKWKVKYDGQEVEVDEDELVKGYAHNKAAEKRMREAAELRKQAEEFIDIVKKDPRKLLTHPSVGVDVKQFAEQILAEYMEEQMLSPEEKEVREMKRKLAEYENERKAQEEARQQAQLQEAQQQYMAEYEKQFTEVLSTSGLPKTEYTVARLAYYMSQAIEHGYNNVQAKDVVTLVKEDYMRDIQSLFGAANEDVLLQMLGDQNTEKAVKAHMNKIKSSQKQQPKVGAKEQGKTQEPGQGKKKPLTKDEWRAQMAERNGYKADYI